MEILWQVFELQFVWQGNYTEPLAATRYVGGLLLLVLRGSIGLELLLRQHAIVSRQHAKAR